MGKGNVCVSGPYEGLYYIDNDDIHFYVDEEGKLFLLRDIPYEGITRMMSGFEFDEFYTRRHWEEILDAFSLSFCHTFPSFSRRRKWIDRSQYAILENGLFYITVEDNQWSMAVKLVQKEDGFHDYSGLQKRHYKRYLDGIQASLFEQFESLGVYGGAWTSGSISRSDYDGKG